MAIYTQRPTFWRIFYGVKARDMIPWQVALLRGPNLIPHCGGTILDSRTILSAAHCVQNESHMFNYTWTIRAGSKSANFGGQVRFQE